jgi:plasmid stabilization system protein ParE
VKFHVLITQRAEDDAAAVFAWFRKQSAKQAGARWLNRMYAALDRLETSPDRCRKAAESADLGIEIRELTLGRGSGTYRILFQIEARTVHILRIWHAARRSITAGDLF